MTNQEVSKETIQQLLLPSTATLTSVLRGHGVTRTFMHGVAPLEKGMKMAGPAYTLRYIPAREDLDAPMDNLKDIQRIGIEQIGPGEVLVIDARGDTLARPVVEAFAAHDGPVLQWNAKRIRRLEEVVELCGDEAAPGLIPHGYWTRHDKKESWEGKPPSTYFTFESLFRVGRQGSTDASNAETNYYAALEAIRRGWAPPFPHEAHLRWHRPDKRIHVRVGVREGAEVGDPEAIAEWRGLSDQERAVQLRASIAALPESDFRTRRLRVLDRVDYGSVPDEPGDINARIQASLREAAEKRKGTNP